MTFDEFQQHALKTSRSEPHRERLLVQTLGLCGEAGEVAESIKKWAWHGKELKVSEVIDELGDVLWYVSDLANALGVSLNEVAVRNVEKLATRYPNGFTEDGGVR